MRVLIVYVNKKNVDTISVYYQSFSFKKFISLEERYISRDILAKRYILLIAKTVKAERQNLLVS